MSDTPTPHPDGETHVPYLSGEIAGLQEAYNRTKAELDEARDIIAEYEKLRTAAEAWRASIDFGNEDDRWAFSPEEYALGDAVDALTHNPEVVDGD